MLTKITKISGILITLLIIGFVLLTFLLPGHSYIIKNSILSNPISAAKLITASISTLAGNEIGDSEVPQNILILGIPGKPNNAPYLTDTIIVAQIIKTDDPSTMLGASTIINTISIPRDLLIEHNS